MTKQTPSEGNFWNIDWGALGFGAFTHKFTLPARQQYSYTVYSGSSAPSNPKEGDVWMQDTSGWRQATASYDSVGQVVSSSGGSGGMPWEKVDFLLRHLGFTSVVHANQTISYQYCGDPVYVMTVYTQAVMPQWNDTQVRQIQEYAYTVIAAYEEKYPEAQHDGRTKLREAAERLTAAAPVHEFEAEEW